MLGRDSVIFRPGGGGKLRAYNLGVMKNLLRLFLLLVFSIFSLAQAPQTTSPQTTAPTQQSPRDECAGCTPQQRQASQIISQGRKLQSQGKINEAIETYKKAMEIAPDFYSVHNALGAALDLNGDYADARHHLQKAFDVGNDEQKISALRSMAISYFFERNAGEAEKYERDAKQMQITAKKPDQAAAIMNELARIDLECGELDKAYDAYKEGYEMGLKSLTKPEDKDLWDFRWENAQARIDARRGLKDQAETHSAAAKAIFAKNTLPAGQDMYVPYMTGYVAFYLRDYKTALGELLKGDQRDPFILALIAQTYEKLNDKVQAKEYWTKVMGFSSHNPTNAYARPLAKKALGT